MVDKLLVEEFGSGGLIIENGAHDNVLQNSVVRLGKTHVGDRVAAILHTAKTGFPEILRTRFVNNEIYDATDAIQLQKHDVAGSHSNFAGTIIDNNDLYQTSATRTDCNGNLDASGVCGLFENGLDIKSGSDDPAAPVVISNNRVWGWRRTDKASGSSSWGAAAVVLTRWSSSPTRPCYPCRPDVGRLTAATSLEISLMNLFLTPELARTLLAKRNAKLTEALAAELLTQVDPLAIARYLLTPAAAIELLVRRLEAAPDNTLADLEALREGRKPRARAPKTQAPAKRQAAPKASKRLRPSAAQIEALKAGVLGYLRFHGWSTRKQITRATGIPSPSIYSRVMAELQQAGQVVPKGERAGRVYGLKGAGRQTKAVPKKVAKSSTKKAPPAKRPPKLCPVAGCKNKAAPVFGMMCREHKDLPKAERDELFAERRKRSES